MGSAVPLIHFICVLWKVRTFMIENKDDSCNNKKNQMAEEEGVIVVCRQCELKIGLGLDTGIQTKFLTRSSLCLRQRGIL